MKINHSIKSAMKQLKIDTLHKHQIEPINSILDGQETLVIAPTCSGKSAIFQIPALVMLRQTGSWILVIEPTVSLMEDQVQKLTQKRIPAQQISSHHPAKSQACVRIDDRWMNIPRVQDQIIYITPERLKDDSYGQAAKRNPPRYVDIDDALCGLD